LRDPRAWNNATHVLRSTVKSPYADLYAMMINAPSNETLRCQCYLEAYDVHENKLDRTLSFRAA